MSLKNVIGQEKVVKTLLNEINTKTVKHAYIFHGVEGVGKKFTAIQFVKSLFCSSRSKEGYSCDECETCKKIEDNLYPDVIVVDFDFQQQILSQKEKSTTISIDTIRYIKHFSTLTSYSGKYKAVIIDSAETLQKEAANSLLKLLEEPVDDRIFILITTSLGLLPKTVVSRCEHLKFLPLNKEKTSEILFKEKDFLSDKSIILGSIKELKYIETIRELDFDITKLSIAEIQELSAKIAQEKDLAKYFLVWLVENVLYRNLAEYENSYWFSAFISDIENYIKQIRYNIDIQLLLETFLSRLKVLCNKDILLT
ncbi:MAG: hypothetical protein N2Z73_03340 [Endomicrobia bacterium]|nr:hypothetical protein [Endomicrobiia bacterium]